MKKIQKKESIKVKRKNNDIRNKLIEYSRADRLASISKKYNKMDIDTLKELHIYLEKFLLGSTLKGNGKKHDMLLFAHPMREDLIKEYGVITRSEFMLLDAVIINYLKFISYQQYLACCLYADNGIGSSSIKNIEKLQKVSDISFNNYLHSMSVLRQMKLNPMNINIKNSQVNIGKNQQIINKDAIPELNESK